jgi:DHA3 family macrolide efflux protein-like MFS transporter
MVAGGIIVGFISIPFAMYIDSVSFFISALAIFAIAIPKSLLSTIQKRAEIWTDIKEGFRYVVSEKPLLWLMILVPCINFTLSPIVILLPKFTKNILGAGPKAYSVIFAAMSVGGLISSSLLSIIGDIKRKGFWILAVLFGLGVANVLFAFSPSVIYATVIMAIAGIMITPAGTLAVSIFQTTVPNEKQGRVFGLMGAMSDGLRPISIALAGALGDVFSARLILASGGCLLILIVLCAYLFSQIM